MEKYGFVYIWYDRKHKRFYIGAHWGLEADGYICSSNWMKQGHKHRPKDFKRRILKTNILTKKKMFEEENRYLDMIKPEELGKKYYNLQKHWMHWSSDEEKRLTVGQKISRAPGRSEKISKAQKGKIIKESTKEKLRIIGKEQWKNMSDEDKEKQVERLGGTMGGWNKGLTKETNPNFAVSEERKRKVSEFHKGRKRTEETKKKMKLSNPIHKKIKCPHCDKESNILSLKRWHFDNCKQKAA